MWFVASEDGFLSALLMHVHAQLEALAAGQAFLLVRTLAAEGRITTA